MLSGKAIPRKDGARDSPPRRLSEQPKSDIQDSSKLDPYRSIGGTYKSNIGSRFLQKLINQILTEDNKTVLQNDLLQTIPNTRPSTMPRPGRLPPRILNQRSHVRIHYASREDGGVPAELMGCSFRLQEGI